MKKFIIIFIIVIFLLSTLIVLKLNKNKTGNTKQNQEISQNVKSIEKKNENENDNDNIMVIAIDSKTDDIQEEKSKTDLSQKDPAILTQEIYDINGIIGTLNIPKTRTKHTNI